MKIQNLQLQNYQINIDIDNNEIIGVLGQNKLVVEEFLLTLAGINKSKDNCFFEDIDIYDNSYYFSKRIYLNCFHDNVGTLKAEKIADAIATVYHKDVNIEALKNHIKNLSIHGECEITLTYEYKFTDMGNSLINMALALSIDDNLIINNPTIHITKKADIDYLKLHIQKHKGFKILGLDNLLGLMDIVERVLVFTDYDEVIIINPNKIDLYLIEDCLDIKPYRLFKGYGNRVITTDIPKEILKKCDRNRIKYTKVNVNEIEKYISN
jgi:hypothetical protein